MAFFKNEPISSNHSFSQTQPMQTQSPHEVETIVGPSVKVEGDFNSQGNVLVQGIVSGNVKTDKYLQVEEGAKITANVRADSAKISGEIQGNIKIKNQLELTSTARVVGDIEAKVLIVAAGALMHGKCSMIGAAETIETKTSARSAKRSRESEIDFTLPRTLIDENRGA